MLILRWISFSIVKIAERAAIRSPGSEKFRRGKCILRCLAVGDFTVHAKESESASKLTAGGVHIEPERYALSLHVHESLHFL